VSTTRLKGEEAIVARYGSRGSFAGRLLYTWFTLTVLYAFTWPLLVLMTAAPGTAPWDTPLDWFQLRVLPPALIAVITAWLWRLSPVPHDPIDRSRWLSPFRQGRIWPQVLVFLLGLTVVISFMLVLENPSGALKLITLTLAEAAVIQMLVAGYVHGAFDLLLRRPQSNLPAILLFALTFGMRGALATVDEDVLAQEQFVVALSAGIVAGALIGLVAVFLRNRTGSLTPGIVALWLGLLLLALPDFYAA
jgi:uncharacterized protein YciU (UPF0263 family)